MPTDAEPDPRGLLDRATGMASAGRVADARACFRQAVEAADRAQDAEVLGEAVLGLGGLWVNEQRAPDEYAAYRALVDRAILATADPLLTARLRVRRAADARGG